MLRRVVFWGVSSGTIATASLTGFCYFENYYWDSKPNQGILPGDPSRPKLVVLGTGWSALSFLRNIDTTKYDVVCVSPRNYFLFTPLLPAATVGTVEHRSIVVPIREALSYKCQSMYRRIANILNGYRPERPLFLEVMCTKIDHQNKKVVCEDVSGITASANAQPIEIPYDTLVIAIGAQNNTFNTPGVHENCHFLTATNHAIEIRSHIIDLLETAVTTESIEDKRRLLRFLVVGGGPSGVEFAAELDDFLKQDLRHLYPRDTPYATVTLVQSTEHLLSTYDQKISEYTEQLFRWSEINLLTNTRVLDVKPGLVTLLHKPSQATHTVPFSLCVWATGVSPTPVAQAFIDSIPEQSHSRAIAVDCHLRVLGLKDVYAMGDCSTLVWDKLSSEAKKLFVEADEDKDGHLSLREVSQILNKMVQRNPNLAVHVQKANKWFESFDKDHNGFLEESEFMKMLKQIDSSLKALPSTAQVADQQGHYLAHQLNGTTDNMFVYRHKGELAYVGGDHAAATLGDTVLTGATAGVLWRIAFLDMLAAVGWKNTLAVSFDWAKAAVFGRDTSRV
eukprot:c6254_g1_i1.p1 GENE.c6254_g1_i1~~c6254_g1_i1.p1  ORF type:complete len:563 (+),score=147.81 c6254_g1_i1:33-1721(+)